MGHYYSEMCCDKCGLIRCTCPPPPKPVYNDKHFVIDGLKIVTVGEFKQYYGVRKYPHGYTIRTISWETGIYNKKLYEKKKDAEKDLLKKVKQAAKNVRSDLKKLEALQLKLETSLNK